MQAVTERLANAFVAIAADICYHQPAADWLPDSVIPPQPLTRASTCREGHNPQPTFYSANWTPDGLVRAGNGKVNVSATLGLLAEVVPNWETAPQIRLTLKTPEGYAFYALYPEQYGASALRWAAEHAGETISKVRVIGIRSIGTSLAAVVRAALHLAGWNATWQTVRPTGHPYERQAKLDISDIQPDEWALIVDEGPGQSGSSMASVAQALVEAGMARDRIAFLPGHGGEPGGSGSETTRQWWANAPRIVTPTDQMRWNGLALPDVLAARTPQLIRDYVEYRQYENKACDIEVDADLSVLSVEDFGGGLWRRMVYAEEAHWPAVCAAFERPKYRLTLSNGTQVLWKFAGLASSPMPGHFIAPVARREGWLDQSQVMELWLAMRGIIMSPLPPAPLGTAMGFVAMLWITGTPLTLADATPAFLSELGSYIGACSAPPLSPEEAETSIARLTSLLYWNTWEALGEEAAEQTRQWSAVLEQSAWARQSRTFGDGHLAPHEWLRMPEGQRHKTDCIGYEPDHTIIGRQSIAWDIAGALVEWRLEETTSAPLLEAAQTIIQRLMPKSAPLRRCDSARRADGLSNGVCRVSRRSNAPVRQHEQPRPQRTSPLMERVQCL